VSVRYEDNVAVDVATLDDADVSIVGPGGTYAVTYLRVDPSGNGTPRTAVYRLNAPGGFWDPADNGTYTVNMQASEVRDPSGNYVAAGAIGTFTVSITPPTLAITSPTSNPTYSTAAARSVWAGRRATTSG